MERLYGKVYLSTQISMIKLVEVLNSQEKYDEAEEMHRQALASRETALGKEHPNTPTSIYSLAHLLH